MSFQIQPGCTFNAAQPVQVYRNLNKKGVVYSIKQAGKVIGYATHLTLTGCSCVVKEKARERVCRLQVREVHAWVEGMVSAGPVIIGRQVSYNPYKHPYFYDISTALPVTEAKAMAFGETGVFYI